MVKVFDEYLSSDRVQAILTRAKSASEEEWALMNEPEVNGVFWDNKRMMIEQPYTSELLSKLISEFEEPHVATAANKVQRFFDGDVLGPLVDAEHVPQIAYSCILFLNSGGPGIYVDGQDIQAQPGRLVLYSGKLEYKIDGYSNPEPKYFITIFFNKAVQ